MELITVQTHYREMFIFHQQLGLSQVFQMRSDKYCDCQVFVWKWVFSCSLLLSCWHIVVKMVFAKCSTQGIAWRTHLAYFFAKLLN